MHDVAIIGGGPAGSTAALLLARAGWDVTLIEQHRFPRDKVCGECLSAVGYDVLGRLGLAPALHAAGAVRLNRTLIHAPNGKTVAADLPRPMWGLSRQALDELLLGAAVAAGARLLQPARCEAVTAGAGPAAAAAAAAARPVVRVRDLSSNKVTVLAPAVALVADGKCGLNPAPPRPTGDFGIKAHFEYVMAPYAAIELFGTAGRYGGLAPIEGGRWNAAFSVRADDLRRHRGDVAALFDELVRGNPALARRLDGARQVGRWLASPLPRFAVQTDWPGRIIPIGNAAAALEPIGGEGMGLAMGSAELAAEALIAHGANWTPADAAELFRAYRRLWRTRRPACRAAAVAVSSRRWSGGLVPLARSMPRVVMVALALMGKTGS